MPNETLLLLCEPLNQMANALSRLALLEKHLVRIRRGVAHQRHELADLQSQRVLHIPVRPTRRHQIIAQQRILLANPMRTILCL